MAIKNITSKVNKLEVFWKALKEGKKVIIENKYYFLDDAEDMWEEDLQSSDMVDKEATGEQSLLLEVAGIIEQRRARYGTPTKNFTNIAERWQRYLSKREERGDKSPLKPQDVAAMMIEFKLARAEQGEKPTVDTLADIIGYAECWNTILKDVNK